MGKMEVALKTFQQILEIDSKDKDALSNIGQILMDLNRFEESM